MKTNTEGRLIICIALLMMAALAGCTPGIGSDSENLPPNWIESSIESGGLTRWYRVYTPDPLPEDSSIVLYLHGGTLSMRSILSPLADSTSTWPEIAEQEGVVLVVPNGVNPETGDTYGNDQNWNDLRQDGAAGQHQVDDVGFLLALLDKIESDLGLTQPQIFVTGASNGGFMTYRLLIEAPERFAAGAAFIANLPDIGGSLSHPKQPTPLMIANGTDDPLVPWDGGMVGKNRGMVISAEETVEWWIKANGADPGRVEVLLLPDLAPDDDCRIERKYFPPSSDGAPVLFYSFLGGGHTLPTVAEPGWFERLSSRLLGPVCHDADGILLAWDFFSEFSK